MNECAGIGAGISEFIIFERLKTHFCILIFILASLYGHGHYEAKPAAAMLPAKACLDAADVCCSLPVYDGTTMVVVKISAKLTYNHRKKAMRGSELFLAGHYQAFHIIPLSRNAACFYLQPFHPSLFIFCSQGRGPPAIL